MTAKEKDKDNLYVRLIYVQDGESVINRRAGRGVPVFLCELASTEDFDCMQPAPEPIYCYTDRCVGACVGKVMWIASVTLQVVYCRNGVAELSNSDWCRRELLWDGGTKKKKKEGGANLSWRMIGDKYHHFIGRGES